MKLMKFAAAAAAIGMSVWMTGCMSMDEMLASDNSILRDIGERRAVAFATEPGGEQTIEERLAVIPKIRNQECLARIYIARDALSEVKKSARERMTDTSAFIYVILNSKDKAQLEDALNEVGKDDAKRLEAAWELAIAKPDSAETAQLLGGVQDAAKLSGIVSAKMDELTKLADSTASMRRQYGDKIVEGNQKKIRAMVGALQMFAPYMTDEAMLEKFIARPDIQATRDTEIDLYTPFKDTLEPIRMRKSILALADAKKEKILRDGSAKMVGGEEVSLDAKADCFVCGKVSIPRAELEASVKDRSILERIAAEKAAAEARRQRRIKLAKVAEKFRTLPEDKRADLLAKLEGADDRLVLAWELAANAGTDRAVKNASEQIVSELDGTQVAKFLRDEVNSCLRSGSDDKAVRVAVETIAPFAKDELIVTPLYERLRRDGYAELARPLKSVSDSLRLAALGDKDIRRLLNGESITKEDKYVFKMNSDGLGENGISPTRDMLIAALADGAFRNRLVKEDGLYKDAALRLGYGNAEEIAKKIRLSLENDGFVPPPDPDVGRPGPGGPDRLLYIWQYELAMACHEIEKKDTGIWLRAAKSFDDDPVAKAFFVSYFIHDSGTDDADDAKKAAANAGILATLPQKTLEDMFIAAAYYREGIETIVSGQRICERNYFPFGFNCIAGLPVIAKAIKDKEIIKHLLFDYDGWARYRRDEGRRARAYQSLVDNINGDEDMIWQLYANTAPTIKCDVISVGYLSSLAQKLGEPKRKSLTDAAFARAAEVAKTNVVVKGYYLGMSLADFQLINAANGSPATGTYDNPYSRKMTRIAFDRNSYNKFLGINTGNPISDIDKFGRDYGSVPDGVDVSDKIKSGAAVRTQMDLEGYSSEGVWKWVDTYHKFQAEINDSEGTLVFRPPVVEGLLNSKDIRQEQANAVFDLFAGGSDDEDVDYYD